LISSLLESCNPDQKTILRVALDRAACRYPDAPITPERFVSLFGRGGADDCFSWDLSPAELAERLQHLRRVGASNTNAAIPTTASSGNNIGIGGNGATSNGNGSLRLVGALGGASAEEGKHQPLQEHMRRVLFLFSEEDEYVPHTKEEARRLGRRIAAAAGGEAVFLEGADHAVSSPAAQAEMLRHARPLFEVLAEPPAWWRAVVLGFRVAAAAMVVLVMVLVVLIVHRVGAATTSDTVQFDVDSDGVLSLREAAARTVLLSDPVHPPGGDGGAALRTVASGGGGGDAPICTQPTQSLDGGAVAAAAEAAAAAGRWTTGQVAVAFAVYAVCSVPLVLVGVRCAGRRVRDSWLQEGRRRYQKEMLQAVAS
jgi:hypothetical protein